MSPAPPPSPVRRPRSAVASRGARPRSSPSATRRRPLSGSRPTRRWPHPPPRQDGGREHARPAQEARRAAGLRRAHRRGVRQREGQDPGRVSLSAAGHPRGTTDTRRPAMHPYPLIADHGLIGDLQTAALVSTDGAVDWFCAPRFDSPSIFGGLLDHERGGHFRVRPSRRRLHEQAALLPRHRRADHPLHDRGRRRRGRRLHAGLEQHGRHRPAPAGPHGPLRPRPDDLRASTSPRGSTTAASRTRPSLTDDGAVFRGARTSMTVHLVREPDDERLAQAHVDEHGDVHADAHARAPGRCAASSSTPAPTGPARQVRVAEVQRLFDETVGFWESWLAPVDLHRSLAGDAQPLGDHAQADDLRPQRRRWSPRRRPACPSRSAASATGTTATPGSGTRRSPSTRCSAWASPRRPRRSRLAAATACTSRPAATAPDR